MIIFHHIVFLYYVVSRILWNNLGMNKSQNSHYCNSLYRYGLNYSEDIAVVYLMMIILPLIMYIPGFSLWASTFTPCNV